MQYDQTIITPKGLAVHIRNGAASDGSAVLENFNLTHAETDYLLSYPDENHFDAKQESQYLEKKSTSPNEIELIAFVDGKVAGTAGIDAIGTQYKVAHRAEFGISILKEYWGLGIGRALMEACIHCAKTAGYAQLELEVVAENARAISMYQTAGFVEYGRNPKGFRSRNAGYQELISMPQLERLRIFMAENKIPYKVRAALLPVSLNTPMPTGAMAQSLWYVAVRSGDVHRVQHYLRAERDI